MEVTGFEGVNPRQSYAARDLLPKVFPMMAKIQIGIAHEIFTTHFDP